jgi:SpoVK/Ycf46/Vps4 family AAA+-type ATPase
MIAQEMSNTANRGKVIWVFASSRPDLIEEDLKRPGRIDVKIPILPAGTPAQACALIVALAGRFGLELSQEELEQLQMPFPSLLTPGAAEALVVKAYRVARTEKVAATQALARSLVGYQSAVPQDVLELQIRLAIREATDLAFVPTELQHFAVENAPEL